MGFSAVALADAVSVDAVSPGAPTFSNITQFNNNVWHVDVLLPSLDADGSALTGLTKLYLVTQIAVDGVNPFVGLSPAEILAYPGAVTYTSDLTEEMAGTVTPLEVSVLNTGGAQSFACFVSDEVA